MKKIQLLSITLTVLFVMGFVGTANTAALAITPDQADVNVAIVYSTGGLGDNSFNDAAKRGIDAAIATHGDSLNVDEACESDCNVDDVTQNLKDFAESDTAYDLIIGIGFSSADGVTAAANTTEDVNFMIIDSVIDLPNVASITFKEHEGSFLAGALAAMVTETETLGFLGGLDIPLINKFGAGFEHGAKYINPGIDVIVSYSPDPNNPWGDLAGGKQTAETMIDEGADIIFAAAGGTGLGVFDAVDEQNDLDEGQYYGIGVDSNQDGLSEGNVLTSMVKRVDVAVEGQIDAIFDDTWEAGVTELGLAEDGVGITEMEFTEDEKNAIYEGDTTNYEKVQELKAEIIDGNITVASSYDELDTISFEEDTPVPLFAAFMGVFAVAALIRRKKH